MTSNVVNQSTSSTLTSQHLRDVIEKFSFPEPKYSLPLRVLPSPLLTKKELRRMCRSKRKRIRKKWLKNQKNYRTVPDTETVYLLQGQYLVCHPALEPLIIAELRKENAITRNMQEMQNYRVWARRLA